MRGWMFVFPTVIFFFVALLFLLFAVLQWAVERLPFRSRVSFVGLMCFLLFLISFVLGSIFGN